MSTSAELARASSFRTKYAPKIANGLTLFSPTFAKIFHNRRASPGTPLKVRQGDPARGVEWEHGGEDYTWQITKSMPTASRNRGALASRSFSQPNHLDKAVVQKFNIEQTVAISEGDFEANQNDETKLDNLWKRRCILAQSSIWLDAVKALWGSSTQATNTAANSPDGLAYICSPGNVASGSYAGIAMATTSAHWTPTNYQYTGYTIAANLLAIIATMKLKMTRSEDADGAGMINVPDMGVFNSAAWTAGITFGASKYARTDVSSGGMQSMDMVAKGFDNLWIDGVDCFPDLWWGGSASAYLESAASEEFIMGHSDRIGIATTAKKSEGLVRGVMIEDPVVISAKQAGVFKTGLHTFFIESPVWFGLAYL